MKVKFIKEGKLWFADLPLYKGPKSDCLMVAGAPEFLSFVANKSTAVELDVFTSPIENPMAILNRKFGHFGKWAYYNVFIYDKEIIKGSIGLCPVSSWFFGGAHPSRIYVQKKESK